MGDHVRWEMPVSALQDAFGHSVYHGKWKQSKMQGCASLRRIAWQSFFFPSWNTEPNTWDILGVSWAEHRINFPAYFWEYFGKQLDEYIFLNYYVLYLKLLVYISSINILSFLFVLVWYTSILLNEILYSGISKLW